MDWASALLAANSSARATIEARLDIVNPPVCCPIVLEAPIDPAMDLSAGTRRRAKPGKLLAVMRCLFLAKFPTNEAQGSPIARYAMATTATGRGYSATVNNNPITNNNNSEQTTGPCKMQESDVPTVYQKVPDSRFVSDCRSNGPDTKRERKKNDWGRCVCACVYVFECRFAFCTPKHK